MRPTKRIAQQTVVITGASSGIGPVTARMAVARGARLVLASRSRDALRELLEESERKGAGRFTSWRVSAERKT